MTSITRRTLLGAAATLPFISRLNAQGSEIKVALLAPLSGPWARQGELKKMGAELAIEDINKSGGIKALNGAKLKLMIYDAGDSTERAKNAAQRMVARDSDLVAGVGAWLSSFTLAVTEVTERAQLPWLTLSFADQVTERGFRYIIDTSAASSRIASETIPLLMRTAEKATGKRPETVGLIGDSGAVVQAYFNPLRQGGLEKVGLKAVIDETYTAPLTDATSLAQKVRTSRPTFLILYTTNVPDAKLTLEKLGELGLGKGRIPIVAPGAHVGTPEMLANLGAENLEGVISFVANWGSGKQKPLLADMCRRTKEPWMTQDTLSTYGEFMLIADALERAASADREKVMDALRKTDTAVGPAQYFLGGRLRFDGKGRRIDAPVALFQWQNGQPITVSPEEDAASSIKWPRRQA